MRSPLPRPLPTALVALSLFGLSACGGDDGAGTRGTVTASDCASTGPTLPGTAPTATATGSEAASSSGSEAASGTGSAACDTSCKTPPVGGGEPRLDVTLDEWSIAATPSPVTAGRKLFAVTNTGSMDHELVIVKGDSFASLPVVASGTEKGAVDETKLATGAFVGEVEGVSKDKSCAGSFTLEKGSYVLFCNLVHTHDGKTENHFTEGMRTVLTVN